MHATTFNRVIDPDCRYGDLTGGQSGPSVSEWLKRQRDSLLETLGASRDLAECLAPDAESLPQVLTRLLDLLTSAIANAEQGREGTPAFGVLAGQLDGCWMRLQKTVREGQAERWLQLALTQALPVLGEQRLMIAQAWANGLLAHRRILAGRELLRLECAGVAAEVAAEMVRFNVNRRWKITGQALESSLQAFLSRWLATECHHPVVHELSFCTTFADVMLREINTSADFWELLLLRLERRLGEVMPAPSAATETLLAAVERFDFINLMLVNHERLWAPVEPLRELILVRMLLDAFPSGSLGQQWLMAVRPDLLAPLGVTAGQMAAQTTVITDALLAVCERMQADWAGRACQYLTGLLRAREDHDRLMAIFGRDLDQFAAKITEGLTDATGIRHVALQLRGLFLAAREAWLLAPDMLSARAHLRHRVATGLITGHLEHVWKKYREICLTLAQMDTSGPAHNLAMPQVQALMRDLDGILGDCLRGELAWWPASLDLSALATDQHGGRESDLRLLLTQVGMARRLEGTRSPQGLIRWYAHWLQLDPSPARYAGLRKAVAALHDTLAREKGLAEQTRLLGLLLARLHECTAVRNLALTAGSIAANTSATGMARYGEMLMSHPEGMPPGGNEKAWTLGIEDNVWTLQRIRQVWALGLPDPFQSFAWWWSLGVAKHLRRVPLAFLGVNIQSLSQALFDELASDEALAVLNLVKAVFRQGFGLDTDVYETSPAIFVSSHLQGKVWQQVFRPAASKGQLFLKHAKAVRKAAPPLLGLLADPVSDLMARNGDAESAWRMQLPHLFALIEQHGTHTVELAWLEWRDALGHALPAGMAALWTSVLDSGLAQLRQTGMAVRLLARSDAVREQAAVRMADERIQVQEAGGLRAAPLGGLIRQVSVALMTEAPSMAALNIGRWLVSEGSSRFGFSTRTWRLFWLGLDEALRPHLDPSEQEALTLWTGQWLAMTELLPHLRDISASLLGEPNLVFADSFEEELQWREAVSGILAAALATSTAPFPGALLAQRLFLSCGIFHQETPFSWNERRLALEKAYESIAHAGLRGRLADRHSQIATCLFNRERLLEAGDLEPTHQFSLMLPDLPWARTAWRFASLARQVDEGRTGASYDDSIVANVTRDVPPNSTLVASTGERIQAVLAMALPSEVVRKRWLGSQSFPLTPPQGMALRQLLLLATLQDIVPGQILRRQAGNLLLAGFAGVARETALEYVGLFLESLRKQSLGILLGSPALDRLYEHCIASLCAQRLVLARGAVTRTLRQDNLSGEKPDFIEMCISHLGLFLASHQAEMEYRRTGEVMRAELFPMDWDPASQNMRLAIQQLLKEVTASEQRMLSDFATHALTRQEATA